MKKILVLSILFVFLAQANELFSQSAGYRKAEKQYADLKYKKALTLYLKEYNNDKSNGKNTILPERIANCYRLISDTKNAEIWYEIAVDQKKSHKINFFYYAQMLQANGDYENAKIWFNKYSKSIKNNKMLNSFLLDENTLSTFKSEVKRFDINLLSINSDYSDMGPAFYEDKLVFSSTRDTLSILRNGWNSEPFFDLYVTDTISLDSISNIKKFDKKINSPYHEGPLCFHPKKDIVYFTRSNYNHGKKGRSNDNINRLSIYKAEKGKDGWKNIQELWFNSPDYSTGHPTLSSDGLVLIFSSDMPGGYGGTDLYFSVWNDSVWSEPINLGKKINTTGNEMFPYLSPDGKLFFSSNGRQGLGGLDIFCTWPSFENIEEIRNMGMPINSTYDDFGLIMDKKEIGYFVSDRPEQKFKSDNIYGFTSFHIPVATNDTLEIELSAMVNDKLSIDILSNDTDKDHDFSKDSIKILTSGTFDKEFRVDANGEFVYWVNKYFDGVKKVDYEITDARGLKDTASVYIIMKGNTPPNANPDKLVALQNDKGRVIDVTRNDFDKEENIMLDSIEIVKYPSNGGELVNENHYVYYQPAKDFIGNDYFVYKIKDTRGGTDMDTVYIEVLPEFMAQTLVGGKVLDLSVYFDFNQWKIKYQEKKKLDQLVLFMKENPNFKSQVIGHTDPVGGNNYNLYLSKQRAKEAANYLSINGINKNRLKVKGEGEKNLIYKNSNGDNYKDEKNILNRRTTIKVLDL